MQHPIDIFAALGDRLKGFGNDNATHKVVDEVIAANGWFTRDDILRAIDAICSEMLVRERLEEWLAHYPIATEPKRVAVIMAGNIPLAAENDWEAGCRRRRPLFLAIFSLL